ncbi:MAG TPA: hypothetical protein VGW10_12380, partial [Solirubrobacteraceae bacterium]|nr:hypothetical protein [Solirubrobacteraceae bacterium]
MTALLVLLLLVLPASAGANTMWDGTVRVTAEPSGGLRIAREWDPIGTVWGGLFVRMADGPLAGRLYGGVWSAERFVPVSSSPVSVVDGVLVQETEYALRAGELEALRIRQTVRLGGDGRAVRVTYRVRNAGAEPVRFRALAAADLAPAGADIATGHEIPGVERFIGALAGDGTAAGAQEVRSSVLPGEAAPTPVAAWAHAREADAGTIARLLRDAGGIGDGVDDSGHDAGAAVAWEDHLDTAAALAPGEEARYEVLWHAVPLPRLQVTTGSNTWYSTYVGSEHRLAVTLRDLLGRPSAGVTLRVRVSGANGGIEVPAAIAGADGTGEIAYVGTQRGYDDLVVWADLDGDGAEDPGEPSTWRSVYWSDPPPRLSVWREWRSTAAGNVEHVHLETRDVAGYPAARQVRWSLTGANSGGGTATSTYDGRATVTLHPVHAGDDELRLHVDDDGDGEEDAGEPVQTLTLSWSPPPPPITIQRDDYHTEAAGLSQRYAFAFRRADGTPAAGASYLWRLEGTNATEGWRAATASAGGAGSATVTGCDEGHAVLTALLDENGDGVAGADEPRATRGVWWGPELRRFVHHPSWYGGLQVGTSTERTLFEVRDACSVPATGSTVRWTVTGANPTSVPGSATVDANGYATVVLDARQAGTDEVLAWHDRDGDGVRDDAEPAASWQVTWAPPPPPFTVYSHDSWYAREAGSTRSFTVVHHDGLGKRAAGASLRWWVEGPNARPAEAIETDTQGYAWLSYVGARPGEDTLVLHADADRDGEREAGEPEERVAVLWEQPAPPPSTSLTADGAPLDVTLSSVGALRIAADDPAFRGVAFDSDTYSANGFHLAFLEGALGTASVGTSRFYGEGDPVLTVEGDERVLRSSYVVRTLGVDRVRVRQTVRHRDGDTRVRVAYEVENLTGAAISYRPRVGATLQASGGAGTPLFVGSGTRFLGFSDTATGLATGIEEVAGSPWSGYTATYAWDLGYRLAATYALGESVGSFSEDRGVAVEWGGAAGDSLEGGGSARYELVWRVGRPDELGVTPAQTAAETGTEHRVAVTLRDGLELPEAGTTMRWTISGAHERSGAATTDVAGVVSVAWTGRNEGRDQLTVYADRDDDGFHDPEEPLRVATIHWRMETAVDPPVFDPVTLPDGTVVNVNTSGTIGLTPSQAAAFPRCADGSAQVNLGVSLSVNTGASVVVAGSMTLRTVPRGKSPELYLDALAPTGPPVGDTYRFVVECLRDSVLYLCYTLEEEGLIPEEFCVLIGGLGLWDPQGIVYDRATYDKLVRSGVAADVARVRAAVPGARVVLERRYGETWRRVLSGDPFISPNRNGQETDAEGRFGWNVAAGTYRVVVTRDGYEPATSRSAVVPPPDLSLHVGLERVGGAPEDAEPTVPSDPATGEPPGPTDPTPPSDPPTDPTDPAPGPSDPAPPSDPPTGPSDPAPGPTDPTP